MSKVSKPCPIPGCGGEGEETGSYTTCKKRNCAFRTFTFHWQALPRLSESVLEVARELRFMAKSWRELGQDGVGDHIDGLANRLEGCHE